MVFRAGRYENRSGKRPIPPNRRSMPTSWTYRATSWPRPCCRGPNRGAATPTCGCTASAPRHPAARRRVEPPSSPRGRSGGAVDGNGSWGVASPRSWGPRRDRDHVRAVHVATTLAVLNAERVELASEPVYTDATWVSNYRIDPFSPGPEKIAVLEEYSGRLLSADGIDHVSRDDRRQGADVLRRHPRIVDHPAGAGAADAGRSDRRRRGGTISTRCARWRRRLGGAGRWWPATRYGTGPTSSRSSRRVAEKGEVAQRDAAPKDLVIDPSNLWLTIHESIGHATEYDRRSATRPPRGCRSPRPTARHHALRLAGDERAARPHARARVGQYRLRRRGSGGAYGSDLVSDGIFVGYQLDRVFAPRVWRCPAPTGARTPISRITCGSSGWLRVAAARARGHPSTDDLIARVEEGSTLSATNHVDSICYRPAVLPDPRRSFARLSCAMLPIRAPPRFSGTPWKPSGSVDLVVAVRSIAQAGQVVPLNRCPGRRRAQHARWRAADDHLRSIS